MRSTLKMRYTAGVLSVTRVTDAQRGSAATIADVARRFGRLPCDTDCLGVLSKAPSQGRGGPERRHFGGSLLVSLSEPAAIHISTLSSGLGKELVDTFSPTRLPFSQAPKRVRDRSSRRLHTNLGLTRNLVYTPRSCRDPGQSSSCAWSWMETGPSTWVRRTWKTLSIISKFLPGSCAMLVCLAGCWASQTVLRVTSRLGSTPGS